MKSTVFQVRKITKLTTADFCKLIGIPETRLPEIESGGRIPEKIVTRISKETGVSSHWLRLGKAGSPPVSRQGVLFTHQFFEYHRFTIWWKDFQKTLKHRPKNPNPTDRDWEKAFQRSLRSRGK